MDLSHLARISTTVDTDDASPILEKLYCTVFRFLQGVLVGQFDCSITTASTFGAKDKQGTYGTEHEGDKKFCAE
jgi:hypothetical protein